MGSDVRDVLGLLAGQLVVHFLVVLDRLVELGLLGMCLWDVDLLMDNMDHIGLQRENTQVMNE